MKRNVTSRTRDRYLTPEEAANYRAIREQIELEKSEINARIRAKLEAIDYPMAAIRFNVDQLARLLVPHGFSLNLPEAFKRHFGDVANDDERSNRDLSKLLKSRISFARPSAAPRLYDHIRICPPPEAFAELIVSAATFESCHRSVSNVDGRFRTFLSENSQFQTSHLTTAADVATWLRRLAENASTFCEFAAAEIGPALSQRLQPTFTAVDRYEQSLGDMFSIFEREFAFVAAASANEQAEIERLTDFGSRMLYLKSEDAKLASFALVQFGSEVDGKSSWHRDAARRPVEELIPRLILLTDLVRKRRGEYEGMNGLARPTTGPR